MLGQGDRDSSTMSNPAVWRLLSLAPIAQVKHASPYRVCRLGKGFNLGAFWWKPERIESSIPVKNWLTSAQAWIWLTDFQEAIFCVWFWTAELHKTINTGASSGNSRDYNWNSTCVPQCRINMTQSSPLRRPLNRVRQRVGHLHHYMKEVGKELCFSHIGNENWQTVLKEQVREV